MTRKVAWTDAQDSRIRRLCREGAGWEAIAADLAVAVWAVTARGRRIGAGRAEAEFVAVPEDKLREPLPAGHPTTWGAINAGTVLRGRPYPLRVFRH